MNHDNEGKPVARAAAETGDHAGAGPIPGTWTAFVDSRHLLTGEPKWVVSAVQHEAARSPDARVQVFDNRTGETVDWDPRNQGLAPSSAVGLSAGESIPEVPDSTAPMVPRGPGRPRLGVVAREVTLLPRHWEWLAEQPGGASVALRKLVDQARRASHSDEERRRAREATYRFMAIAAGNEPGFEEAIRALFAGQRERFEVEIGAWPQDLREHARRMARGAFDGREARDSEISIRL